MTELAFSTLLDRVRNDDQAAAAELVQLYEPVVRRQIRLWIQRCRPISLQRLIDSTDVSQSVFARFFVAVGADRLDLDSPDHLQNLLLAMARNRFHQHLRDNQTLRRDIRRNAAHTSADLPEPVRRGDPSERLVEQELLERVHGRLTPEERELIERRTVGQSWADVAASMGGTADGRRLQLARVWGRIVAEFGPKE